MPEPEWSGGFIVLCDIAGFSGKPDYAQKQCVEHLDKAVVGTRLWALLHSEGGHTEQPTSVLNCTGDGFILITTHPKVRNHPDLLLQFVKQLLHQIDEWNVSQADQELRYQLRIGLNEGKFFMGIRVFGATNAIGGGVNMASRVAGIGDPGHVLVSEDVIKSLRDTSPAPASDEPDAPVLTDVGRDLLVREEEGDSPFWEVVVKHGQLVRVRPWHVSSPGQSFGSPEASRRVKTLLAVQKALQDELERLHDDLCRTFRRIDKMLTPEALALRLTVLFANTRKQQLICTPVRYWRSPDGARLRVFPKSEILYPFAPEKYWGMPAFIYRDALDGKGLGVQWQCLPAWIDGDSPTALRSQEKYIGYLGTRWSFPKEQAMRLNRKARCYFGAAIPGIDGDPFGVLMGDTAQRLPKLTKANKGKVGQIISSFFDGRLPSLLHIRYSP